MTGSELHLDHNWFLPYPLKYDSKDPGQLMLMYKNIYLMMQFHGIRFGRKMADKVTN
jgi:hypothetical protein